MTTSEALTTIGGLFSALVLVLALTAVWCSV